jgi:hypothetical protein
VTQNLVGEGEVLIISMPGQEVPQHHSGLRPSEKELPERRIVSQKYPWLQMTVYCSKDIEHYR